jgi:hypothetical protein
MTDAATIANRYIALWNETDPGRRKAMLADLWSDAGTYLDPLMQGQGHDRIDALIAGVRGQFPDFRFALVGQPDGYGDQVRFSWQLGPEAGTVRSRVPTSPRSRMAASPRLLVFSTRCRPPPETMRCLTSAGSQPCRLLGR